MTDKDIRQLIREGLTARDWTVPHLARECVRAGRDITPTALYRYLEARSSLGADTLETVLRILDIRLVGGPPKVDRRSAEGGLKK